MNWKDIVNDITKNLNVRNQHILSTENLLRLKIIL
jgi:hypothetical protein